MVITPKREAILRHVARYGLTLRPVLDRIFFADSERDCESDLTELRKQRLLSVAANAVRESKYAKTAYSYYYLTRQATALLGVSDNLAKQPGPEAVPQRLAFLWHCCMSKHRSHRLGTKEVSEVLYGIGGDGQIQSGAQVPNGYHCISLVGDYRLLNVYAPQTTVTEITSQLRKRVTGARAIPAVDTAIKQRQYGFLVLVESKALEEQVWEQTQELAKRLKAKFLVHKSPGHWRG